jgi:hypothetical protein
VKKFAMWAVAVLAVALAGIQLVPIARTNPPVETEITAPPEVIAVLRRSCYDCHSNETDWPWYSRVAPVSWLIASDVSEARHALNLSTWNRLVAEERLDAMREIWDEVSEGKMPLWFYLPIHPDARLSAGDLSVLQAWTQAGEPENPDEDAQGF